MRILNLTREFPFFPGGHGGNTRTFCLIRELSRSHAITVVTNAYAPRHLEAVDRLREHTENLLYYRDPAATQKKPLAAAASEDPPGPTRTTPRELGLSILRTVRDLTTLMPREVRLWSRDGYENIRPSVEQALREEPYDVLQIEYSESAGWVRRVPFAGPKILVVHDVKTIACWRRFRSTRGLWKRLAALDDTLRFYFFERRIVREFDFLVAMSDDDRQHLQRLTAHPNIGVVPNGVDIEHYHPMEQVPQPNRIVFTATMNHPPNSDGILFFAREIWPHILADRPDTLLDIVGSNPPQKVRDLANDSIRVTGFVPDTRPYIAQASVFICPLRFASGTRLKILEAMAMGRAVVSTHVGAEGIECEPGVDLMLADDPMEFARAVVDLLQDPARTTEMGRAARQTSHAYSWPKLAERQDKVYQEVRADHASRIRRRRPRIGLNGLFLVPGGATGGLDPYFRHLVKNLLKLDHESQYVLLTNPANTLEFTRLYADNLRKQVLRERLLAPAAGNMVRSLAARALGLPPLPQRRPEPDQVNVDLIHCIPGYIDDFAWGLPCILTVADIQHEYHPEFFSNEELSARKGLYEPSIRHAKHIIAISKFTRQTLIERFEVAPDKISVVHLGVDARFFASVSPSAIDAVRTKYGLPKAYCIYPANLWPHKNHSRLLEALAELDPARRPHLVLTGAATPTRTPLRQEIQQRGLENQVSWLGYVETGALPALFKGARMMIFPSLFEGFGLPVVEAMGVGCPVACSQTTSLPEVVGEAAVLFDPTSTGAIAAAIESLWLDDAKRQSLGVAGREQARRYSWRNTALRTLQLYRQTIKETYGVDMQEEPA